MFLLEGGVRWINYRSAALCRLWVGVSPGSDAELRAVCPLLLILASLGINQAERRKIGSQGEMKVRGRNGKRRLMLARWWLYKFSTCNLCLRSHYSLCYWNIITSDIEAPVSVTSLRLWAKIGLAGTRCAARARSVLQGSHQSRHNLQSSVCSISPDCRRDNNNANTAADWASQSSQLISPGNHTMGLDLSIHYHSKPWRR